MSNVKIWVHAVWATKNRERILSKELRRRLFQHICDNALRKGIHIDVINGDMDHVHCLFGLNGDMSISKVLQLIKGESTHWANSSARDITVEASSENAGRLTNKKISWADEYYAVSVSESLIDNVRSYIRNQEEHHKRVTFNSECKEFIEKYKFEDKG